MDHQEPVVLTTVKSEAEAEIIRNFLRAEGIECELGGDLQAGLPGVVSIPIMVPAKDADQAVKIFAKHRPHGPGPHKS